MMTGEARADPMLGYTRQTEVQVIQDTPAQTGTPAGTETQDGDTRQTATEPKADHPTDSGQATIDHRLHTPGITLGVDHPHATTISHIGIAYPYKTIPQIMRIKIMTTQMTTSMKI